MRKGSRASFFIIGIREKHSYGMGQLALSLKAKVILRLAYREKEQ